MASYAYLIAPPEAASTLQGIFGALFEGVGTLFRFRYTNLITDCKISGNFFRYFDR